jgi:hypothetical protein
MNKNELIHLHSLLTEVREKMERENDIPDGYFNEYEELEITPEMVYVTKGEQKKAVVLLARKLANLSKKEEFGSIPIEESKIKQAKNLDDKDF